MIPFNIIVAVDEKFGIGKDGGLPWHLPADLKYFKTVTTHKVSHGKINAVIMGRKTWESIPIKFKPLPERLNVVVSRQADLELPSGVILAKNLETALDILEKRRSVVGEVFVIGGAQIFNEAVKFHACQRIYLTAIKGEFSSDAFFPDVLKQFVQVSRKGPFEDNGVTFFFCEYLRSTT